MDNSTGVKVVGSRKNKIETINRCEKRNMKCFQNIIKVLLPINNMTLSYIHRYDILPLFDYHTITIFMPL